MFRHAPPGYVVSNHLAQVISQNFASAEDAAAANGFPTVEWPASDPLVTGLGTPNAALLIPDLVDAAHS